MYRALAIDKDTVHVEISSHDYRVVIKEKEALKGAIPCRDRYWDPGLGVWVIRNPEQYKNLWYIDHALRKIMTQMELPCQV
jgi:hypothetical protein